VFACLCASACVQGDTLVQGIQGDGCIYNRRHLHRYSRDHRSHDDGDTMDHRHPNDTTDAFLKDRMITRQAWQEGTHMRAQDAAASTCTPVHSVRTA
jgi:hypothetical protein